MWRGAGLEHIIPHPGDVGQPRGSEGSYQGSRTSKESVQDPFVCLCGDLTNHAGSDTASPIIPSDDPRSHDPTVVRMGEFQRGDCESLSRIAQGQRTFAQEARSSQGNPAPVLRPELRNPGAPIEAIEGASRCI